MGVEHIEAGVDSGGEESLESYVDVEEKRPKRTLALDGLVNSRRAKTNDVMKFQLVENVGQDADGFLIEDELGVEFGIFQGQKQLHRPLQLTIGDFLGEAVVLVEPLFLGQDKGRARWLPTETALVRRLRLDSL